MTELEVRCCCNPAKLLGWLNVPTNKPELGHKFCYRTADGEVIQLEIGEWWLEEGSRTGVALKSGGHEKEIQEIVGFRKNGGP